MPRFPIACLCLVLLSVSARSDSPDSSEIARLVLQLGADQFRDREAASKELQRIGEPAVDALRQAAASGDEPEVRRRARQILETLEAKLYREPRMLYGPYELCQRRRLQFRRPRLLTSSYDGTVRLWDAASGNEIRCFRGHTSFVTTVAFSPDGQRAVSGSHDRTVRLWDVRSGRELRCLRGHTNFVNAVAFSPDGKQLLSGSSDDTMRLWNLYTGEECRCFRGHTDSVVGIAFSPDGRHLLSGSGDNTIRLWDAQTGQELQRFQGHTNRVQSEVFSPDGKQILSGSCNRTMRLWSIETGKEIQRFQGHEDAILVVASTGRQARVVGRLGRDDAFVGRADGRGSASLRERRRFRAGRGLQPGGKQVAAGNDDDTLRLWRQQTNRDWLATLRRSVVAPDASAKRR